MHLSMLSRWGGRPAIGRAFEPSWTFLFKCPTAQHLWIVKIATKSQENVVGKAIKTVKSLHYGTMTTVKSPTYARLFGGRGLLFEERLTWVGSVWTLFPSLASRASISTLMFSIKSSIFQTSSVLVLAIWRRISLGSFDITIGVSSYHTVRLTRRVNAILWRGRLIYRKLNGVKKGCRCCLVEF